MSIVTVVQLQAHTNVPIPKDAVPVSTSILSDEIKTMITSKLGARFMVYAFENKVYVRMPNAEGNNYYCITASYVQS